MSIKEQFNISQMEEFVTKEDLVKTKFEFIDRVITIIIAGLGLIAALAWDEALKHLFKTLFKEETSLWGDIGYAVVITLLAAIVSIYLRKIFIKKHL
jgi:uncharacterized membrane protein YidH (DUF202 family)